MLRAAICRRSFATAFRTFSTSPVTQTAPHLSYPSHAHPTPHEIFHLRRTASQDEIKERYYELVRVHHPDSPTCRHEPDDIRQERFKAITKAYDILKSTRSPAYIEEVQRRQTQSKYPHQNPTRRHQFAYGVPEERLMGVGSSDVAIIAAMLVVLGSVALVYSPFSARQRVDKYRASASHALADARRESKGERELSVEKTEQEGVTPEEGQRSDCLPKSPSSN
ncbi:hypothetical protein DACRYDRAFT_93836 [Dacryopinax primogenitus]|uniref:J domain-containing protein n=1 Tax=Dacryopinax primogenitus (strain DJM 731) TaxID=1858805 RepID=M5G484_DACPD|nr:uncharacterized protein DACRYDRAFT_93836 [Dacryopinax primogenitus]EJU03494.1 hypothetical protein DACRYDRAFT_93836 [Dacryopinax primogenitus]